MIYAFNIDPMGAVRQTKADAWKKRPGVLRYRAFKDSLRYQLGNQPLPKDPLIVNLTFYIAMPDSWSKEKREAMLGAYHRQKPDKDNCEKAVTDTFWPDNDSMIADGRTSKRWAEKGRIVMEVHTFG